MSNSISPISDVILLNYGAGNMASIRNSLDAISVSYTEIDHGPLPDPSSSLFILPGVGSFAEAASQLNERGFNELSSIRPRILGICLGMQLLFSDSYEDGFNSGLGLIDGSVRSIQEHSSYTESTRLPHVGWQPLQILDDRAKDCLGCLHNQDVYFVHSYMAFNLSQENILASVSHSSISVPAIVARDRVLGFQFHPEKSGPAGLNLLKTSIHYLSRLP